MRDFNFNLLNFESHSSLTDEFIKKYTGKNF